MTASRKRRSSLRRFVDAPKKPAHKEIAASDASGAHTMKGRSTVILAVLCLVGFFADCIVAKADEVVKFRMITHAISVQSQDVGDVDGHIVAVGRYSGLATFPDGSVGSASFTFTIDYIKGAGTFLSYYNVMLNDGSSLWWKGTGQAKPEGTTTVYPEHPISVLHGTGRFEGVKGGGSQTAVRVTPLSTGADLYADVVLNLSK